MFSQSSTRAWMLSGILATASQGVAADDQWRNWQTSDRFGLQLDFTYLQFDSHITIEESQLGRGRYDLNDALNFDNSDEVLELSAFWRMARRHTLRFHYGKTETVANETLKASILGFPIDNRLRATYEGSTTALSYNYSFIHSEYSDFYGGVGLSLESFKLAIIDEKDRIDPLELEFDAPIPTLILGHVWAMSEHWNWRNQGEALALKLAINDDQDISGQTYKLRSEFQWRATSHLAVLLGYQANYIDVEGREGTLLLGLDDIQHGPFLGIQGRF